MGNYGPYAGLCHNESAVYVTSVIHDQYNVISSMQLRGEDSGAVDQRLDKYLNPSTGVKKEMQIGLDRFSRSEESYKEILGLSTLSNDFQRSNLTTNDSFKLYCSFFDPSTTIAP